MSCAGRVITKPCAWHALTALAGEREVLEHANGADAALPDGARLTRLRQPTQGQAYWNGPTAMYFPEWSYSMPCETRKRVVAPSSARLTMIPCGRTIDGKRFGAGDGIPDGPAGYLDVLAARDVRVDAVEGQAVRRGVGAMHLRPRPAEDPHGPPTWPPSNTSMVARWLASARSSMRISASPFPSWIAPGQLT